MPGTSYKSNPNAMRSIAHDTIYTNVALTDAAMLVGRQRRRTAGTCIDWRGNAGRRNRKKKPRIRIAGSQRQWQQSGAGPRARKAEACRSARSFSAAAARTVPLVYQAFNWIHGVYFGATMATETTAAAAGAVGRCDAIRWRCCRFAATTWATTSSTGSTWKAAQIRRRSLT